MRGKVSTPAAKQSAAWITPAYAGKSGERRKFKDFDEDHPRLCGEKPDWDGLDKTAQGSPPPMRGKASTNSYLIPK